MNLRRADHGCTPARIEIPRDYNAAHDLLEPNAARPEKLGFAPESRVMLAMLDSLEWPVVFLGCILAGLAPVAAITLLTAKDFSFMLHDSRAHGLVVS